MIYLPYDVRCFKIFLDFALVLINVCLFQVGHYTSVIAMAKDIDLLVKNAKTYNEPGSQVFKVGL